MEQKNQHTRTTKYEKKKKHPANNCNINLTAQCTCTCNLTDRIVLYSNVYFWCYCFGLRCAIVNKWKLETGRKQTAIAEKQVEI